MFGSCHLTNVSDKFLYFRLRLISFQVGFEQGDLLLFWHASQRHPTQVVQAHGLFSIHKLCVFETFRMCIYTRRQTAIAYPGKCLHCICCASRNIKVWRVCIYCVTIQTVVLRVCICRPARNHAAPFCRFICWIRVLQQICKVTSTCVIFHIASCYMDL